MLKKAGIVVVAATAGMLAVSPMALAKDRHHDDGGINILNIEKNTLQVNPQICNNNILDNIVVAVLGRAKGKFDSDGGKKCTQHNKIDNSD
ncbi:MAG: hypothetical protein M3Z25_11395 [Actinomycetota bacterium]|nr:hypothetical protein [Actinomycetota bacterium]